MRAGHGRGGKHSFSRVRDSIASSGSLLKPPQGGAGSEGRGKMWPGVAAG